jgi:Interferon-induced transmembrane protein
MYCPRCGEASKESDRFCNACGLDLTVYRRQPELGTEDAGAAGQASQWYQHPQYHATSGYGAIPHVPNYLGWAIVVLLCFWPTGIPAVIYAAQVNNKLANGDVAGAQESSRKAKMWCWITFGIAAAFWVFVLCGWILLLLTAVSVS